MNYYNFITTPSQYGEWGTMDYLGEPSSKTPKYNALVAFINSPSLVLTGFPSIDTAGTAESFTVTAFGPNGSGINTGYTGTVQFTSSDPNAVLPAAYTFTAADAGVHTFTIALKTAGVESITVTDSADGLSDTQSLIMVQPAAACSLAITGFPTTVIAGVANNLNVTAYDAYGNVANGFTGTVHFTSSDTSAELPLNYTFTSGYGSHTFVITTLYKAGVQTITATDSADGLSATQSPIMVQPAAARSLAITGLPTTDTAGVANNFIVTAHDAYGNIATGYTGTVHFTSTDPNAVLPVSYTFSTANAGVGAFSATLKTAGKQSLNSTDVLTSSITGTDSGITVHAAAASSLVITSLPTAVTAGAAE